MVNSKQKGKRIELEFKDILIAHGWKARRGVQYSGDADAPDVVCEALPIHWEVKGDQSVASVGLLKAIKQAENDCPKGKWRCVVHKKDGAGRSVAPIWMATLPLQDFLDLVQEWDERTNNMKGIA